MIFGNSSNTLLSKADIAQPTSNIAAHNSAYLQASKKLRNQAGLTLLEMLKLKLENLVVRVQKNS